MLEFPSLFRNTAGIQTLKMIRDMRSQFREILEDLNLLSEQRRDDGSVVEYSASGLRPNENSDKWNVVKAALFAGLHPNLIRVDYGKRRAALLTKVQCSAPTHCSGAIG